MEQFVVAALYKFVSLPDYKDLQGPLQKVCLKNDIKGTLLLAEEGINGTVSGPREGIDALLDFLKKDDRFADIDHKESYASVSPFYRMKVRLKQEIVTMGLPEVSPTKEVGTYVEPEDWNELLEDEDVVVLDTRNDYEVGIGTFKNALNPETETFREFPEYVRKTLSPTKQSKVAMFCTGGIRCEKASSYMKSIGYDVYHLKGGILKYLETVPQEKSLWEGECFVFDNRVSVKHGLDEGSYDQCFGCRYPISEEDKESPQYIKGVTCPHCYDTQSAKTRKRAYERQKQMELAKERGETHIGRKSSNS